MRNSNTYNLTKIGIMAAFVMAATFFKIEIPIGSTNTMLHLGNAVCLLSGLLLGPTSGAMAAAIGSAVFDMLNPIYISSMLFTFTFKFIMVFICGKIAYLNKKKGENSFYNILGAVLGSLAYIILRISKALIINLFLLQIPLSTAILLMIKSTLISIINSIVAVITAVILASLIKHKCHINL